MSNFGILELREEVEELRERLRKAERAAEREHMSDVDDDHSTEPTVNVIPSSRKKKMVSLSKRLAKKRKEERQKKKVRSCVSQYVGPAGTIRKRHTGRDSLRRVYDIKCMICSFKSSRLSNHLVKKHQFDARDARMKESEIRVLYLWAKKPKHGIPKPLPCDICNLWYLRLDNHLKKKHKDMTNEQIRNVLEQARTKYWCDSEKSTSDITENTTDLAGKYSPKELIEKLNANTSVGINYTPSGAKTIDREKAKQWDIEKRKFSSVL